MDIVLVVLALLAVALVLALTVVAAVAIVRCGRKPRASDAPLLCDSRSDSGSCCDRPHGHAGLHGCVEIMRDEGRTWPCSVYWAEPFRVESRPLGPRGLDPVTVTDGRVERVTGGARR